MWARKRRVICAMTREEEHETEILTTSESPTRSSRGGARHNSWTGGYTADTAHTVVWSKQGRVRGGPCGQRETDFPIGRTGTVCGGINIGDKHTDWETARRIVYTQSAPQFLFNRETVPHRYLHVTYFFVLFFLWTQSPRWRDNFIVSHIFPNQNVTSGFTWFIYLFSSLQSACWRVTVSLVNLHALPNRSVQCGWTNLVFEFFQKNMKNPRIVYG